MTQYAGFEEFIKIVINFQDKIPELLVHAVCKSYLMSMVWVGWIYFCYVMLDLNSDSKQHFRTKLIMAIVSIVESITSFATSSKI